MEGLPNIINTNIVKQDWDSFWQELKDPGNSVTKKVLIISSPFASNSAEDMQLQKMLQACKLSTEDYNLFQIPDNQNFAWHKLREHFKPKMILLLGISPQDLGISALFKFNEACLFNDVLWLATVSLSAMEQQPDLKVQLWNSGLKPIFVEKKYSF
ncbi:MAG: hypothetical protein ACTHJ0_13545 [Flavipsychrobacter sp.]